jgi:hypothetical protein
MYVNMEVNPPVARPPFLEARKRLDNRAAVEEPLLADRLPR